MASTWHKEVLLLLLITQGEMPHQTNGN